MTGRALAPWWILLTACSTHPARFADRPAATDVLDTPAIALPRVAPERSSARTTDAHVRRVVLDTLDPERHPAAGDVNALDEVPRSSWFAGASHTAGEPPVLPLRFDREAVALAVRGGLVAFDARGTRFELVVDPTDRPETRTAAVAIASRLVRALGWRAPEAHVLVVDEPGDARGIRPPTRMAAVRWPPGVDLGPTPTQGVRDDDRNDRVAHQDRRTLRALRIVVAWLALEELDPRNLRDAYVGAAGRGHVEHFVVGLDGAFGLDRTDPERDPGRAESLEDGALERMWSLGLARPSTPRPPVTLADIEPSVDDRDEATRPPFYPGTRCSAADAWWAAKRIAAITPAEIERAVEAGRIRDAHVRSTLAGRIRSRQRTVLARAAARVTPLDLGGSGVTNAAGAASIALVDRALASGIGDARAARYEAAWLEPDGESWSAPLVVRAAAGGRFAVVVPPHIGRRDYAVLRVWALRDGDRAPRPFEVHLAGGRRIVGVRH